MGEKVGHVLPATVPPTHRRAAAIRDTSVPIGADIPTETSRLESRLIASLYLHPDSEVRLDMSAVLERVGRSRKNRRRTLQRLVHSGDLQGELTRRAAELGIDSDVLIGTARDVALSKHQRTRTTVTETSSGTTTSTTTTTPSAGEVMRAVQYVTDITASERDARASGAANRVVDALIDRLRAKS